MSYQTVVFTPMFDELSEFFQRVDEIIQLLKKHRVNDIEMYYGWSWGEWLPFTTTVGEIMNEINGHEKKANDKFGSNDVYIKVHELDTEIVFCHETDLHICYNSMNPLVSEVIASWKKDDIVHAVRVNNEHVDVQEWLSRN